MAWKAIAISVSHIRTISTVDSLQRFVRAGPTRPNNMDCENAYPSSAVCYRIKTQPKLTRGADAEQRHILPPTAYVCNSLLQLSLARFTFSFEMVSLESSHSHSTRVPLPRSFYTPASAIKMSRNIGRSMRTIRSNFFEEERTGTSPFSETEKSPHLSEDLTDSVIDLRLGEIALRDVRWANSSQDKGEALLEISCAFSYSSGCSSDISGELQRLASFPSPENVPKKVGKSAVTELEPEPEPEPEPCLGFLRRENFSPEIIESLSSEDLQPIVKFCVDGLQSTSVLVQRSAAAKLRLLAKNRTDNRVLIGESGAVPALIPLLRSSDPCAQEHAVTALLNLSLHESNKVLITNAGAIKSLVYVLKTGTETSKQNAACALLSLSLLEDNKSSIGVCGALPLLVSLLVNGSNRGKKDALTTLYKLCSIKANKERAVSAGAVTPLVELVTEQGMGLAEKAMVVLSSLAAIGEGREAIVEEGGIAALVEAIEDGSLKGKDFAVSTLLQLCADSVANRCLLVREGGIPPLVALSQTASPRAKLKSERLLAYLREQRQDSSSPSP